MSNGQSLNLNLVLDQVAKDKGIERSVLVATLEDAMKTAAKKHFGQDRSLEAKYDADKGVVELFQAITVENTSTMMKTDQTNHRCAPRSLPKMRSAAQNPRSTSAKITLAPRATWRRVRRSTTREPLRCRSSWR